MLAVAGGITAIILKDVKTHHRSHKSPVEIIAKAIEDCRRDKVDHDEDARERNLNDCLLLYC